MDIVCFVMLKGVRDAQIMMCVVSVRKDFHYKMASVFVFLENLTKKDNVSIVRWKGAKNASLEIFQNAKNVLISQHKLLVDSVFVKVIISS